MVNIIQHKNNYKHKNFCTVFPDCENIHLIKDVGMIPYIMQKYFGYNSYIVGYNGREILGYLDSDVKGLHYIRITNTGDTVKDFGKFIVKNAKKIDVLQLYHITTAANYRWIFLYKLFNPKGYVYLKLDAGEGILEEFNYHKRDIRTWGKRILLGKCKLISIETKKLANKLTREWGIPVHYIANGYYSKNKENYINYSDKKNIICTVGRLGTRQKNTEELLEAFAVFYKKNPGWQLRLVGSIEKNFENYIIDFMKRHKELKDSIVFCGMVSDRKQLKKEYAQAKIFCLSSRWESFAIVFTEALSNGCYIISSKIDGIEERTGNGKFGMIYPVGNKEALIQAMEYVAENEVMSEEKCHAAQDFAYYNYYWPNICKKINLLLK